MEFKRICKDFDLKLLQLDTWGMLSPDEIEEKKSKKKTLQNDYENNIITLHEFDSSIKTLTEGLEIPSKEDILERCKALR
ncbi:hypothetical protein [Pseudobutyrivibrio ruminis]|uniref:Uncharacterized protein n=1 Tax=Pseudobutyrivibrio ruminis DSM 9787 TaxID=1123011 RepID=A0A285TDA9_9FIRM|nr:hypothetical protein [Pseudobutyrivibrio ruminis]SOC17739.1 hypothetical protein SAMN02910411_0509 [Pseudobutyrivibrio ruminis DSM 9787]